MAGFGGSYRAQMQTLNELKAGAADFSDAMATARENAEFTKSFLTDVNLGDDLSSMLDADFVPRPAVDLGEYGSLLEGDFVAPVADLGEMAGGELAFGAIAEESAAALAFGFAAEIALPVGAIALGWYFSSYGLASGIGNGWTSPNGGWTKCPNPSCDGPLTTITYTTNTACGLFGPCPSGQANPGLLNPNANSRAILWMQNTTNFPDSSFSARFTIRAQWLNSGPIHYGDPVPSYGPSQRTLLRGGIVSVAGLSSLDVPFGRQSAPESVSDPFPASGDDPDHPRNVVKRWRPGPQDWPNVPRYLPGVDAPEPPEGGTSGGGGASGKWGPKPVPLPRVWRPWESEPEHYKVPAQSYRNVDGQWEVENDWHMLVPDYAIKILMDAGIYEKSHFFKSPEGLDHLYRILAKSIPSHPCVGLKGSALVGCVMRNLDGVSWKHFAGQVGRESVKVEKPGVVRTLLRDPEAGARRWKKAFRVAKGIHSAVSVGVKRSRVFSGRKGMF